MGRPAGDLTGKKFGRLLVLRPQGKIGRNAASLCLCDCGTEKVVANQALKAKNPTLSCGCLHKERASKRMKEHPPKLKHGLRKTSTYQCWSSMIGRCYNQKNTGYSSYGGRGITVCDRWRDPEKGITNFIEDMGERPSSAHSIDRVNGAMIYSPETCRWATPHQQNQNVGLKKSNTSGYKGIHSFEDKWVSSIRANGSRYHLGLYKTKEEAALAYNIASERLQGVYGRRNALPPMNKEVTRKVFDRVLKIIGNESHATE